MAYEIELKAHVREEEVESVKNALLKLPDVTYNGVTGKFDMYWSHTDNGEPLFRTRREMTQKGPSVIFTAKPHKTKTEKGTEENQEFEFSVPDSKWGDILNFCSGIGLQVCRLKWKNGHDFTLRRNGFDVHAELIEVRYLGWFLEIEICVESMEGVDTAADMTLRDILSLAGLSEDRVESRGYNRMLKAIGHEKG